MYLVDYHTHPASHGEDEIRPLQNSDLLKQYVQNAENKNINELGFSDHDSFLDVYKWENLKLIKKNSNIDIKLGIEVDYFPDKEEEIKIKLNKLPIDYVIGSVHHIGEWNFDHEKYIENYDEWDINELYKSYYNILKKAVKSELFDIIGHLDLIKVFNNKINKMKELSLVKPVLHEIKVNGMAIEVNVNGLNKPVQEIYPAKYIIEEAVNMEVPITFGSDAHRADRVGENIDFVFEMLKKLGVSRIASFDQRELILTDIEK